MRKILIIEDEVAINRLMEHTLIGEGFYCDCALDGEEGADYLEKNTYDLVLLDIMLPKIDGYELLSYIQQLKMPVIIISAMVEVSDRIKGLKMGADDYLCKPFQIGELLARVESLLRRTGKGEELICVEDVSIDVASRQVVKAGSVIDLTVKEFDLLVELARHKNVAMSRARLYEAVWQEDYLGQTRTLDSHMQRLRKKLNWNEQIKTVFRIGYRLEVPK